MKIWLDDEFAPFKKYFLFPPRVMPDPSGDWVWAKSAHESLELSQNQDVTDFAVDNDLGLRSAEGKHLLMEILEMVRKKEAPQFANTVFYPITNNSAVQAEMLKLVADIYRVRGGRESGIDNPMKF